MPPLQRSRFPDGQIAAFWDVITGQLTQDPILHNAIEQWQIWDGSPDDTSAVPWSQFPALRLTPTNTNFRMGDEQRLDGSFVLRIAIAVPTTSARDIFNFWEAVKDALSRYATSVHDPAGGLFGNWLIQYGCYSVAMTGPAFEPTLVAESQGIGAQGTITFLFNLDS